MTRVVEVKMSEIKNGDKTTGALDRPEDSVRFQALLLDMVEQANIPAPRTKASRRG